MFIPSYHLFSLAIIFLLILEILSLYICQKRRSRKYKYSLIILFLFAFLIRLVPVMFFPFGSGYDLDSFKWAGELIINRQDIYWGLGVRHHYAFLPTYGLLTSLVLNITNITAIPFLILTKLPIIFFDSLIAMLIFIIIKNFRAFLVYAFSPIPVILCAYFGQFDAIPLFFALFGLYLMTQKRP